MLPDDFVVEAMIQSTTDPSLAPAGLHTMTLGVQQLPFDLAGTTWDEMKESFADAVLETVFRYAPNLRGHILDLVVITPLDLQRDYGLTGGNIFHGAMFLQQLFGSRPVPELAGYRTPVKGYYLCGSGTHPGGGVMGANGHNAAKVVLDDMAGRVGQLVDVRRTRSRRGLADTAMRTKIGRDVGYRVARQPAFRRVMRLFTKSGR